MTDYKNTDDKNEEKQNLEENNENIKHPEIVNANVQPENFHNPLNIIHDNIFRSLDFIEKCSTEDLKNLLEKKQENLKILLENNNNYEQLLEKIEHIPPENMELLLKYIQEINRHTEQMQKEDNRSTEQMQKENNRKKMFGYSLLGGFLLALFGVTLLSSNNNNNGGVNDNKKVNN